MTAELVCAATDRDAWLTARRSGVTATDIVTILGLNPWASEYALYWEKVGKLPPWEGGPRTRLGQQLEGYVAGLWLQETGLITQPSEGFAGGQLYRSAERPWQLATPDRALTVYKQPMQGVLELKTWDDHDRAAWEGGVPPRVRAQVLWQMDTLGVGIGHVGVLFLPSGEFESRTIEHHTAHFTPNDTPLVAECRQCADLIYMRQVGEAFWARVREGLPPFPDGSPATLAAVKALHPLFEQPTAEVSEDAWRDWMAWKDAVKDAETGARETEARLRLELGGAETGLVGGVPVVKRTRYDVAAKTIDRKAYTVDKLTRLGARNGDSDEASDR